MHRKLTIFVIMVENQSVDPEKLGKNPFAVSLKIEATRIIEKGKRIVDGEGKSHPVEYLIERGEFAKLYYAPGMKDAISKLRHNGKSLFLYIFTHLETGQDYIELNVEHFMKTNNIQSLTTFRVGREELRCGRFIVKAYGNIYWINPEYFFNGNRIKKFPDNVIVRSSITK